jgi:putative glycosyltransferase (TIGR04372 family)
MRRQIAQVRRHGLAVLGPKLFAVCVRWPGALLAGLLAVPLLLLVRLVRPLVLVRLREINAQHIGHLAADTELYLCERDAGVNTPRQRYVDLCFLASRRVSNDQLARMWRRVLRVWPAWMLAPLAGLARLVPGGAVHDAGENTLYDVDVGHLGERFPPHLRFTAEETARGEAGLRAMGIPPGVSHVCLIARDGAYGESRMPLVDQRFHDYRNCDVQGFGLAALALAERGYFVVRMGAVVREPLRVTHPRVLDYATNGMRSDFMDIYLGATCAFCLSSPVGWDAVPAVFRRPLVRVHEVPLRTLWGAWSGSLHIVKRHHSLREDRALSLREIFARGLADCWETDAYEAQGVRLIDNTPEEIRDLAIEMDDRLRGTWQPDADDDALQSRFWGIFPATARHPVTDRPLHSESRARIGAAFLRHDPAWLA